MARRSRSPRRPRRLATAAATAGLTAALGLVLPAAAAQAGTSGHTPPPAEWWAKTWSVPQRVWPASEGAGVTVAVIDSDPAHGALVAEMIAGQGAGGGPVGLAPKARILPVRADGPGPASPGTVPAGTVAAGIRYAVAHGASVVSLSPGLPTQSATYCDPGMQAAVSYAAAHNVVVVTGAGDTNLTGKGPVEPASCSGVLAVGGVEPDGQLWPDSMLEPYVSVAAPADRILTAGPGGRPGTASGTSFASSLVAAVAALIRSRYPTMPWYQVDQRIIGTANTVPPAEDNDYGFAYGYGTVNAAKAVNAAKYPVPASSPNPPYTRYVAWLNTMDGQSWAKANGVAVPSPGGAGASPASRPFSSRVIIVAIVAAVVLLLVLAAIALALRSRRRHRPAVPAYPWTPGVPGAPGGMLGAPGAFGGTEPFDTPGAADSPDAPSSLDAPDSVDAPDSLDTPDSVDTPEPLDDPEPEAREAAAGPRPASPGSSPGPGDPSVPGASSA